jgi:hypothetical protein
MSVFRRFFPNKQQRQRVEQARQMIEHAIRKPREPKGCAASAESGADLRDRLLAVVEDVIPDHRNLFVDLFLDRLAYSLALQGASPDFICQMMTARSEEYAQYRDWVADDNQSVAGTLLWNAAKHVAAPLGCEHDPIFATSFGALFINRAAQALVYELLTGKQRAPAK